MSRKVILDLILLALTAGLIVTKAAYETDLPSMIDSWAE